MNPWVCAVLVKAREIETLAAFYRDVCGLPLQEEGPPSDRHYGCELGDVHFAVHRAEPGAGPGEAGYRIAWAVDDVDAFVAHLRQRGVPIAMEPADRGFGRLATFRDPEGNAVEIVTLSRSWLDHLRGLRATRGALPRL
ncbi:MAG TPA: VOC family protein [Planctomycetota bacterium]|nr:VOC family protein [Planctomycetota bacterium]